MKYNPYKMPPLDLTATDIPLEAGEEIYHCQDLQGCRIIVTAESLEEAIHTATTGAIINYIYLLEYPVEVTKLDGRGRKRADTMTLNEPPFNNREDLIAFRRYTMAALQIAGNHRQLMLKELETITDLMPNYLTEA